MTFLFLFSFSGGSGALAAQVPMVLIFWSYKCYGYYLPKLKFGILDVLFALEFWQRDGLVELCPQLRGWGRGWKRVISRYPFLSTLRCSLLTENELQCLRASVALCFCALAPSVLRSTTLFEKLPLNGKRKSNFYGKFYSALNVKAILQQFRKWLQTHLSIFGFLQWQ